MFNQDIIKEVLDFRR